MSIMVTGAGGMVGSHLVERLNNEKVEVFGTYYKPTTNIDEIDQNIEMIECDVRYPQSLQKVIFDKKPKKIFHLAAQSYPTVSWERPYETMDTNINGTIAIFEAIKTLRRLDSDYDPIVVVACSSAEYGQTLEELNGEKVTEEAPLKPLHPYGVSKVAQDLLAFQYFVNDGIKTIRARIFNTTGTKKIGDVTSDFIRRAVSQEKNGAQKSILRVGNIATKRAIMDVDDLIEALLRLSDRGCYGDVYNISSEVVYEIQEIIAVIEKVMKVSFEIYVDQSLFRPTDEQVIVGDVTKLKRDTNWTQKVSIEDTISKMVEYWRSR